MKIRQQGKTKTKTKRQIKEKEFHAEKRKQSLKVSTEFFFSVLF